jgi:dolichol-phosphate mannosyltransferase
MFYALYNRYSESQNRIKSETFRIISRRAINRIRLMSVNTLYRKSMYSACGLNTDYIEYKSLNAMPRHKGNLKNPYDTALTSLILFTDIAYKATLIFTVLAMLATVISSVYVAVVYFTGNPVAGYTTMMTLMSAAFFALFAILAVVIKYLSVILGLVFNRQRYVLESVQKLKG